MSYKAEKLQGSTEESSYKIIKYVPTESKDNGTVEIPTVLDESVTKEFVLQRKANKENEIKRNQDTLDEINGVLAAIELAEQSE